MSLSLWRRVRNLPALNTSAFIRSKADWLTIFRTQTDGSPEEIAARIFGDCLCYTASRNTRDHGELPRDGFFSDVPQLANALKAFFEFQPLKGGDVTSEAAAHATYRVDCEGKPIYFSEDQDPAITTFQHACRLYRKVDMLTRTGDRWEVVLSKIENVKGNLDMILRLDEKA